MSGSSEQQQSLINALAHERSDIRLRAALAAGMTPDPGMIELLVQRCGTEPDFYVRDMLTWALTRHPSEGVLPLLRVELDSTHPQACSQALHTLSKIGDVHTWEWVTEGHLHHEDDDIARTAWRAAIAVVPPEARAWLAAELAREFGRGAFEVQRSLSRAIITLGPVIEPVLAEALTSADPEKSAHVAATMRLYSDPEAEFSLTVAEVVDTVIDSAGHSS